MPKIKRTSLTLCLYWPELIYQIIDGSFSFLTYTCLPMTKKSKDTLYCLSVWNVVKDHRAYR